MLKTESVVVVTDNTWVKKAKIIRILKSSNAKTALIGDRVVVAVQQASPTAAVKKGEVAQWIIVRVRKEITRKDWTYVRFGDNAIVLLSVDAKWTINPVGKRVFGPVAKELREYGYKNVTNIAEEIV
jgi:large subunit ribosomal protein L14